MVDDVVDEAGVADFFFVGDVVREGPDDSFAYSREAILTFQNEQIALDLAHARACGLAFIGDFEDDRKAAAREGAREMMGPLDERHVPADRGREMKERASLFRGLSQGLAGGRLRNGHARRFRPFLL